MYQHHRNRDFRFPQTSSHSFYKTFYKKHRTKIIHYRDYKNFENDTFRQDLKNELLKFDFENASLSKFNDTVICSWQARSKKYRLSNNCNFMSKELTKSIMNRLKLRNQFLKTKKKESKRRFNRQKNFCVSQKNFNFN